MAASAVGLTLILVELALHVWLGAPPQYRRYRWLVATHLVDLSYADFRRQEAALARERREQGMERGRTHPFYGFVYNPGFSADAGRVRLHINPLGLRGEPFPLEKPPDEIRVMCLGGSTTAGEEVIDAETYPAQLQQILDERFPDDQVRVINAGVPSYDLRRTLNYFQLHLVDFDPDVVTVYHGINDLFYHAAGGLDVEPRSNYTGLPAAPFVFESHQGRGSWSNWARGSLLFAARWSHLAEFLRESIRAPRQFELTAPDPAGVETYSHFYRALVHQVKAIGAAPVGITFALAYPGDFTPEQARKIEACMAIWSSGFAATQEVVPQVIEAQNGALAQLARDEAFTVVDAASMIPHDARHFVDCCHFTAEGNRRMAQALADALTPLIRRRVAERRAASSTSAATAPSEPASL